MTLEPTKITEEYLELDPTKLLEHIEENFVGKNIYVEKFLQALKDNQSDSIKISINEEETKIIKDECLICQESRKILGADCPYCTEGV